MAGSPEKITGFQKSGKSSKDPNSKPSFLRFQLLVASPTPTSFPKRLGNSEESWWKKPAKHWKKPCSHGQCSPMFGGNTDMKIPCIKTRGKSKRDHFDVFKKNAPMIHIFYIHAGSMGCHHHHHHHPPAWKLANTKWVCGNGCNWKATSVNGAVAKAWPQPPQHMSPKRETKFKGN